MASNLRIVSDNATNRATLSATSTAGSLVVNNLLTDRKSDTYRSVGTTTTITATWATSELIGMAATPFCNLTSTATFRVKLYTNSGDVTPVLDTGVLSAQAAAPLGVWGWGAVPLGVNSYSFGGAKYGRLWFSITSAKKMELIITDTSNTAGYVEASRLVCGTYFTAGTDADMGASSGVVETSVSERNDASDLITETGSKTKTLSFSLSYMTPADRLAITNLMKSNGMSRPIYVSLLADNSDTSLEQDFQVYGKLSQQSAVALSFWNNHATSLTVGEM